METIKTILLLSHEDSNPIVSTMLYYLHFDLTYKSLSDYDLINRLKDISKCMKDRESRTSKLLHDTLYELMAFHDPKNIMNTVVPEYKI